MPKTMKSQLGNTTEVSVHEMKIPTTVSFNETELPEIKNWKVGGKYTIVMDVEQIQSEQGGYMGDGKKMSARFKVLKATSEKEKVDDEKKEMKSGEYKEPPKKEVADAFKRTLTK